MPQRSGSVDFLQRIAVLEEQVAALQRAGRERDELPFYLTSARSMPYEDSTALQTVWETILSPRTASLSLGLVTIGDQVGGVNSGGAWQVVLADVTVVMSGVVSAMHAYEFAEGLIDLTPYRTLSQLKVQIKARRTSGAATGAVSVSPRFARLI